MFSKMATLIYIPNDSAPFSPSLQHFSFWSSHSYWIKWYSSSYKLWFELPSVWWCWAFCPYLLSHLPVFSSEMFTVHCIRFLLLFEFLIFGYWLLVKLCGLPVWPPMWQLASSARWLLPMLCTRFLLCHDHICQFMLLFTVIFRSSLKRPCPFRCPSLLHSFFQEPHFFRSYLWAFNSLLVWFGIWSAKGSNFILCLLNFMIIIYWSDCPSFPARWVLEVCGHNVDLHPHSLSYPNGACVCPASFLLFD
jgi:hypothetical protein